MSLLYYVMQSNVIHVLLCDKVERLRKSFIWDSIENSKKYDLISWSTICTLKEDGGLGFCSLRMVNASYMMKLRWNVFINQDVLCIWIICSNYNCGNLIMPHIQCESKVSQIWR